MKVTIEYDNPDEAVDALNLWKYQSIIREILNFIGREEDKPLSTKISDETHDCLMRLKELILESAKDYNIEI